VCFYWLELLFGFGELDGNIVPEPTNTPTMINKMPKKEVALSIPAPVINKTRVDVRGSR
jgi:hypothetical protein